MPTAKDLRAKRANVIKLSREMVDKIDKENREWTAEENNAWTKYNADIDSLGSQVEKMEKLERFEQELRNPVGEHQNLLTQNTTVLDLDGKAVDKKDLLPINEAKSLATQAWFINQSRNRHVRKTMTEQHINAARQCRMRLNSRKLTLRLFNTHQFNNLRGQCRNQWDPENQRYNALSSQVGSQGGATVPEGFLPRFERAQLAFGYMDQVGEHIRTDNAAPLPWPTGKDTGNKGRRLNQSAAVDATGTTTADPTFAAMVLYAYKYTTDGILVPYELLRDSAFDLVGLLADMFAERLGRVRNDDFTNGIGGDQPHGIVNRAVLGVTAASATGIKWDEIIDLEHSVDPSFRGNPGFGYMAHDGIIQHLRKLKNGQGDYLWQPSANSGEPDKLNNRRFTRNQSMQATVATGTKTLLCGDLSKYKIRDVGKIRMFRLVERQRENDQDEFLAFTEADGNLLDASNGGVNAPVKYLVQA